MNTIHPFLLFIGLFFRPVPMTLPEPDSGLDSSQSVRARAVSRSGFRQICLDWSCYTTSLVLAAVFFAGSALFLLKLEGGQSGSNWVQ